MFYFEIDKNHTTKKTESEEVNKTLNKFLTQSSETTSMQEGEMKDMNSMIPKCSQIDNSNSKPASVRDDRTLSNLDSKFDDNSLEQDDEGNLQFLNA